MIEKANGLFRANILKKIINRENKTDYTTEQLTKLHVIHKINEEEGYP
jgi:hypothetical protein